MSAPDPADVIEQTAKVLRGLPELVEDDIARALHDAGLLHTAQDDLDLGDAKRIKAERDELRATVAKVRELHRRHECTGYPDCMILFGGVCAHDGHCRQCRWTYPCPTIVALDGGKQR